MDKVTFRLKTDKQKKKWQQVKIGLLKDKKTAQKWFEEKLLEEVKND